MQKSGDLNYGDQKWGMRLGRKSKASLENTFITSPNLSMFEQNHLQAAHQQIHKVHGQIYNQKSYTKELQMFSMNGILHCLQQTGLGMEECFPLKELRKNSFWGEHNHSGKFGFEANGTSASLSILHLQHSIATISSSTSSYYE